MSGMEHIFVFLPLIFNNGVSMVQVTWNRNHYCQTIINATNEHIGQISYVKIAKNAFGK
jgi:hypothetical protein